MLDGKNFLGKEKAISIKLLDFISRFQKRSIKKIIYDRAKGPYTQEQALSILAQT